MCMIPTVHAHFRRELQQISEKRCRSVQISCRNAHFRQTRRTEEEDSLQKCAYSKQKCTLSTDETGRSEGQPAEVCIFPAEMHTFDGRDGKRRRTACRSMQIPSRNAHFRRARRARSGGQPAEVCRFQAEMHTSEPARPAEREIVKWICRRKDVFLQPI